MAAPDTETQATPDYSGASPDLLAALKNLGGGSGAPLDYGAIGQQLMQQPTLPQPDKTPVSRGWLSLLGEAIGGGQSTGVMSPAQSEVAGLRALRDFGTSLIAGSGYYPGKSALGAFAEGFQGSERSLRGSEQSAAATLAAQQQYAAGQQQQYLERVKAALPLLRMQAGSDIPNALLSANTPAVPGTAGGAGTPTRSAPLTPFIAKNLPTGVSPAEDQMVRTVIGEAGGEPLTGQQGVAAVIKNRMAAGKQDAQSVIFAPNQFEPWNNPATRAKLEGLDPNSQQYQDVLNKAVRPVMSGDAQDPTGGATNFYSPTAQKALGRDTPSWAAGQTPSTVIGGHQFYKLPYGPGTQFAGPGAPPSGSTTTPAATPPTPGQTPPPASTAPAAPPTFADFQAQNPIQITPAEQATMDGLEQAKKQAAIELQRAPQTGVDRVKALEAYTTAANNVTTAQRQIQKDHTDQQVTLYNAEMARQQSDQKDAANRAAAVALKEQEGKQAITLAQATGDEARKTAAATTENSYVLDQRKQFAADHDTTRNALGDYQMLRLFSNAAGTSTPIDNLQIGDKTGRDLLVQYGLGTQAQREKWGAQQAFDAVVNKSILAARQGVSMGQLSDRDMNFLQHMTVSQLQDPQTRSDIISYLEQSAYRKQQYMNRVEQLWDGGKGLTWGNARSAAEAEMAKTDILPVVPANFSSLPDADKRAFIAKNNIVHGSLVRGPDGNLTRYVVGK
jgi:spore germination cell wall hydrolase CwlJ-like protein